MIYRRRHIDSYLDDLFPDLPAIAVEGAKGVGKTETASRRVARVYELDDGATSRLVAAGGPALLEQDPTILLDEWQHLPEAWGWGRRMVDRHSPTEVLLTGSATPWRGATTHSGAGRIVSVLMRPMSLTERGSAPGGVSLTDLLTGAPDVTARCELTLQDYAQEVCASGLPGIRDQSSRARDIQLDSYIRRIIDRDVVEQGGTRRRPASLRSWLRSYAAASTTATYTSILDAAAAGDSDKPARSTTETYRDLLTQIWVLDPIPAWAPTIAPATRLKAAPKHQLVDPALAARLLEATASTLTDGSSASASLLGQLFESLATLCVRAASVAVDAGVGHLRTRNGDHEVDLVAEAPDGRLVAFEVKLARDVTDHDVRHLTWLRREVGERLASGVLLTTGPYAYRRPDGFLVLPLGMLD